MKPENRYKHPKSCKLCGKSLEGYTYSTRRYCSTRCKMRYFKIKHQVD